MVTRICRESRAPLSRCQTNSQLNFLPVRDILVREYMGMLHDLRTIYLVATDSFATLLRKHELTVAQWNALDLLATSDHPMRMGEISKRLLVDTTTTTRLVDSLEARGAVGRITATNDRRTRPVRITEPGRILHRQTEDLMSKAEREMVRHLTDFERRTVAELLGRIARQTAPPEPPTEKETSSGA